MFHNTFAMDIPGTADEQYHTGKLVVDQKDLKPGDIVFFETGSFIFKTRNVGIFLGNRDIAIAKREGLPREKVLATIVSLLEKTLIRVGNAEYAKTNKSYGLTTMRRKHAAIGRGVRCPLISAS